MCILKAAFLQTKLALRSHTSRLNLRVILEFSPLVWKSITCKTVHGDLKQELISENATFIEAHVMERRVTKQRLRLTLVPNQSSAFQLDVITEGTPKNRNNNQRVNILCRIRQSCFANRKHFNNSTNSCVKTVTKLTCDCTGIVVFESLKH